MNEDLAQLRRDLQREIDLRLQSEEKARMLALEALNKSSTNYSQIITWIISLSAAGVALYALRHGG